MPEKKTEVDNFRYEVFGIASECLDMYKTRQDLVHPDDLEKGFDSLLVRVWFSSAFSDSADLFIIKKEPGKDWDARLIRFSLSENSKSVREKHRTDGKAIWAKLDSLKIREYEGMEDSIMRRYADGSIAVIEIATRDSYRLCASQSELAYPNPKAPLAATRMDEFLKVLIETLNFR